MQNAGRVLANAPGLARALILGGVGLYGASNSIYNVEGGHRAIVFNRFSGIKSAVRLLTQLCVRSMVCGPLGC